VTGRLLFSIILTCAAAASLCAGEDYTEPPATVIPLTPARGQIDVKAPASQFAPEDSATLWEDARTRASTALPEQGSGFFDAAERMPQGFRLARNFQSEDYTEGETFSEMRMAITADQAERTDKFLLLTGMKLTVFIGSSMLDKPKKPAKSIKSALQPPTPSTPPGSSAASAAHRKSGAKAGAGGTSAANAAYMSEALPIGGKVVISAPHASINIETNEGHATGSVTIKVFPKREPGKLCEAMAIMETDHLNWRSWSEPSIGTTELAAYTCGAGASTGNEDPDPLVRGQFNMPQSDGTIATTLIEGHGLIFEVGTFERADQIFDEDGRLAGINKTAHNRALFHKKNKMITTASSMKGLLPFQGNTPAAPAGAADNQGASTKEKKTADEPYRTEITCDGPALLDLAAVPRQKPPANAAHTQILLCKRFQFLEHVTMRKVPVDPKTGEPVPVEKGASTNMNCNALVMQYPPGEMPGPTTYPEYAEAIGPVTMEGTTTPKSVPGQPPPGPAPFNIKCERIFLDGPGDNTFLVGSQDEPVEIKHDRVETTAQQFNYRSRSQTFVMPSEGPKRMVIHAPPAPSPDPATPAVPKPAGLDMSSGDTILDWTGTLTREMKFLPVPHQPDRQEEVLTVKENVVIAKPESGLRMRGNIIRIIRTEPEEDVIFVDGRGAIEVMTTEMRATGDSFSVDMGFEAPKASDAKDVPAPKAGQPDVSRRQLVTVIGNEHEKIKATAYMGGTAVRTEKFISDQVANTFHAYGGSVVVVKPPPTPPDPSKAVDTVKKPAPNDATPAASGGNAMFKGVSFQPGATTWMQCDGEFALNGDNTGTVTKNVIIKQPGMQILSDDVYLVMATPPPASPADPKAPTAPPTPAANSMFSGDLKSIDCVGNVEVTTDDQLIHCDRLFHDVEKDNSVMTMNDPENDVRIYRQHDDIGSTEVVTVLKSLDYDGKTGNFKPGGKLLILPYRNEIATSRDKASSPARHKVEPKK
jgi:hypothetical protein